MLAPVLRIRQGTGGYQSKEVHQSAQGWTSWFGLLWDPCLFWVFPAGVFYVFLLLFLRCALFFGRPVILGVNIYRVHVTGM